MRRGVGRVPRAAPPPPQALLPAQPAPAAARKAQATATRRSLIAETMATRRCRNRDGQDSPPVSTVTTGPQRGQRRSRCPPGNRQLGVRQELAQYDPGARVERQLEAHVE